MYRICRLLVAAALIALVASPALAQRRPRPGFGGGMPSLMLLGQKSVQEELKLSDDQVTKVKEAATKMREGFQGLRDLDEKERADKMKELRKDSDAAVAKILDAKQAKRLKQISLQLQSRMGKAMLLANADVAKPLKLDDDQKKQLQDIQKQAREEGGKIFQGEGTREEKMEKLTELRKTTDAKVDKLLKDEQKTKLKEMLGEPFKGKLEFGPRRRPRNN
jgi:Spy/CpxP family protein refolding chaperone